MREMQDGRAVFKEAAQAMARSLAEGSSSHLLPTLADALKDELLAENPDASNAAEARCRARRQAFAEEVKHALAEEPSVKLKDHQHVRVEVRGTAARQLSQAAFAVGSHPDCDVEVFGDPTVLPLQCVVINLGQTILVGDFWSNGGTSMTWRMTPDEMGAPLLDTTPSVFVIKQDERVILKVGERTTITLGPSARKLRKLRKKNEAKRSLEDAFDPTELEEACTAPSKLHRGLSLASTSCGSLFEAASCKSASCSSHSPSLSPAMAPGLHPDVLGTAQDSDACNHAFLGAIQI